MPDVLAQADVFGIAKELFIAVPAAGACVIMVILFLKFLRELSADHKDTSKKFADTLEKLNEDSNRRAKECHEAHATCLRIVDANTSALREHTRAIGELNLRHHREG